MTTTRKVDPIIAAWEARPTGGTDRERQAWQNGFVEALDACGIVHRIDPTQDTDDNLAKAVRFGSTDNWEATR